MTTVIVPTAGSPTLPECLRRLREFRMDERVWVVSSRVQVATPSWVNYTHLPSPATFAVACNHALVRVPQDEDVVLLNDDCYVTQDWLRYLAEAASIPWARSEMDTGWGMVPSDLQPFVDKPPGLSGPVTDYSSGVQGRWTQASKYAGRIRSARLVFFCVYISAAVRQAVGLLDEQFTNAYEDDDYSLRAHKAGFLGAVQTACWVNHLGNRTFALHGTEKDYYENQAVNKVRYETKWRT